MTENLLVRRLCETLGGGQGAEAAIVVQTHISWVILAGDAAYKIKKPLRNAFLDYSTLELRRIACQKELLLNQRYAAELYLGVVAIIDEEPSTGPGRSGPRIVDLPTDEESSAVEFAVRMRRFPSDALLSDRLERGLVSLACAESLARAVGDFHHGAEPADESSPWGSPDDIAKSQRDNFAVVERADLSEAHRRQLDAVQRWCQDSIARLAPAMAARKRASMVRACHGDLHLENIIQWRDRLMPFDGIEFSERLRWIDVQSDAAFVSMDLLARGHAPLANRFTSAYLEWTGDYDGLKVLRWYQVYRAMVRAKVAVLRGDQEPSGSEASRHQVSLMDTFLRTAHALTQRVPVQLLITHGVSGSGKTRGSQGWVDRTGAIRVRSDLQRHRLSTSEGSRADQGRLYSDEAIERTYRRLEEVARLAIQSGFSIVVDATFLCRRRRDRFRQLAGELGVPFQILAFDAPKEELLRRLERRAAHEKDASDADATVLDQQLRTMDPLTEDERALVIR